MNTKRALTDKIALVTGAGRGIGRGIAERLARDGALVAVHYGHSTAAALEVVAEIRKNGGRAFPVWAELGVPGDADAVFAAFDAGLREHTEAEADKDAAAEEAAVEEEVAVEVASGGRVGSLDILVNNAGVSGSGPIGEAVPEIFDRMIAVNAKAPFFLTQRALPRMRDGGRIINISSLASRRAFPESVAYAMSKGALDTMTLCLAKELGGRGITVNTVGPGFIETDMNARRRKTPEAAAALAERSLFNRIGRPSDVADVVAFLASDDSRWITGQYLDVSGGTDM
ncbi:SDR family oxidoreductase [Streptomyces sp. HD]|uniref:SDR family oxidoreductase n=1 Tax=Streptomyces sp. HD TaxID=3020892 RepID=UPI00232B8BA2|nr:SDR family oxidoreductase [Streptomyces sp. HD]MDC0765584.1 SDR family oxidoreductase [Streptomyces sp. HD]